MSDKNLKKKKNKSIQDAFLNFLDNEENDEENFHSLKQIFEDIKILDNQYDFHLSWF